MSFQSLMPFNCRFYCTITALTEIDLSSLEEVRGQGVLLLNNHDLCFFGDITGVTNNTLPNCIFTERRNSAECGRFSRSYIGVQIVATKFSILLIASTPDNQTVG